MPLDLTFLALALALTIDAVFGYPDAVYRTLGHPVTWIGWLIGRLDALLNRAEWPSAAQRTMGVIALCVLVLVPVAIAVLVQGALLESSAGWIVLGLIASTLIASRSLRDHVDDVRKALQTTGVEGGRIAVAKIVGRDVEALDEHAVARAAIESLAENASDGVVAPVFWFAALGLPGLVAYKAINTADSMIGHRTPRHEAFGWAAARLDDLVNLPASRLTGVLFTAAALVVPGASARRAMAAMLRDASRHRSPNAGWPESAMAGALGLKLNGPRSYGGVMSTDSYMGDGRSDATASHIGRAVRLAGAAWVMMAAMVVAAYFIVRS